MKIKIHSLILFCFVCVLFLVGMMSSDFLAYAMQEEKIVYRSATEYDYPPFSVITDGKADGFSVELLKAVANEMELEIEFKVDHWDTIKKELEDGELDVLPLVGYSEEREDYFDFTVPYIVMRGNIFVRKNNTEITSEDDLYGREIIVMRGDNSQEYAERMKFTDKLILVDTYAEAFELLSSGAHDAVLAQSLVGQKLINDHEITNVEAVTRMSDDGIDRIKISLEGFEQKFSFAVKEGDKELLALLNEGLAIVSENGTYESLYVKWFPFLVNVTPDYKQIAYYFALVLFATVVVLLFFSFLMIRKEVKRQTAKLENNLYRNTIMFNVMNQEYSSITDWLDYVLNELIRMTGSEFGYMYLFDEATNELTLNSWSRGLMAKSQDVEKQRVYQLDQTGLWGEVIRQGKPMMINDFTKSNDLEKGYPKGHVKLNNWMAIPVFEDKDIVATVGLGNKPDDYDDNDIYQVTALMSGVWNMIERSNYRDKLEIEKNKYLSTLVSIGDGVMVVGLNERIEMINKVCADMTGWTEEEAKGMYYKDVFRISHENHGYDILDPVAEVLKTGISHELSNHAVLTSKNGNVYMLEDSAAPIKNLQNEMLGVVLVFRDATQKHKQRRQIEFLSFHDALTGLYNRRFFEEEIKRLDTSRNYPLTIIMADLNGLKLTNDAFGHHEGDELLKQTANLFRTYLRSEDIAARWGGDEFVILMPKTSSKEAEKIVQRIIQGGDKLNTNKGILSIAFGWETKTDSSMDVEAVFKNAEEYMYKKKISESQGVRGLTIKTIINTLFEKSPREEKHSKRVRELAMNIAKGLNLSQHQQDDIATLGLLHDIGKIIVSGEILEKPGRLTDEEYNEIKKHPAIGYRMLTATNEFASIAEGVLSHHERWDGKGYPKGIKGDEIPIESRIIAIADAYDAMTSSRPYRKEGMSLEMARQELMNYAGVQFDPGIVNLIIKENLI
ncbi:HD domain-containing phosphohydrolase [Petrocella sp. FN5]|uniref:HD domain-containing phosphohydrolase n=1 Tax=Petrocella sp. FN5 TaxID=3032002 RepID=UPI0023DC34FF|nr:transporter substrate-binding domain-containing protein [Petrocella sp. FN5]MDF1618443.1 transporter substrate-binding domain-containing protein [Petrocella sp. FN5]